MINNDQHARAMVLLENPTKYPGLPAKKNALMRLRLWRYPSFQPSSSWAVLQVDEALFLRRITWDHRRPMTVPSNMATAEPVTYGCEAPIASAVFETVLHSFQAMKLPPFVPVSTCGIDGTSYGFEMSSFALSARFSWWESLPAAWSQLEEWHSSTIAQFEDLLPANTPSFRHK